MERDLITMTNDATTSIEEELQIPPSAALPTSPSPFSLNTESSSIELSQFTRLRSDGRCLLVGRQAATADIRMQHGSISRKHAVLYIEKGKLYVKDLGGKHGTHVNDRRISETTELKSGDLILFGNVRESIFTLHVDTQQDEGALTKESADVSIEMAPEEQAGESTAPPAEPEVAKNRTEREAEIAAMVASLDETPTYQAPPPREEAVETATTTYTTNTTSRQQSIVSKYKIPLGEQYDIEPADAHAKHALTCVTMDKSGSRFAVGRGPHLLLYDFNGMNQSRTKPFKTILVEDGYNLQHLCYSNTGDRLLVSTTSAQPKVFDRDGEEIMQFVRGDQYVMDRTKTCGHVGGVTGLDWHPLEREHVLTASADGSARTWNLQGKTQFYKLVCEKVYSAKDVRGRQTQVTAVAYHPGGREFCIGTSTGSIQVWNSTKVGPRPDRVVHEIHSSKAITFVAYSPDGKMVASRSSEDDTVHVWDARRLSKSAKPLASCTGVPTINELSGCDFSPNGKVLIVPCSEFQTNTEHNKHQQSGSIKFFDLDKKGTEMTQIDAKSRTSPSHVKWHSKINQILITHSDGSVMVLFNRELSRNGAMIAASKMGRAVDSLSQLIASKIPKGSSIVTGEIFAPAAMTQNKRKKRDGDDDKDAAKKRRPEPPTTGFKSSGTTAASTSFTQYIKGTTVVNSNMAPIGSRDPREELFKYQEGKKYIETEVRILADKTVEEEEQEEQKENK